MALAQVDLLVSATTVAGSLGVMSRDKRLGEALKQQGVTVGDVATILKALVTSPTVKRAKCVELLVELAKQHAFPLGNPDPKW